MFSWISIAGMHVDVTITKTIYGSGKAGDNGDRKGGTTDSRSPLFARIDRFIDIPGKGYENYRRKIQGEASGQGQG